MTRKSIVDRLVFDCVTLTGRPIYRNKTHPENLLRRHASGFTRDVIDELERDSLLEDAVINSAVDALRFACAFSGT